MEASPRGAAASTTPEMNAALRRTLGWIAAILLNVGTLLFVVGLIVPRAGGGVSVLALGIGLCVSGLAVGAGWLLGGPTRRLSCTERREQHAKRPRPPP